MNATQSLFAFAALNLAAGLAAAADAPRAPLDWDCARIGAPTYAEVRDHFGIRNFDRAHDAALHARQVAQRACAAGVDRVLVAARDDGAARPALKVLAAR